MKADDLTTAIAEHLRQYTQEVEEEIKKASDDVTKKGVKTLKSSGKFKNLTGKYRKGWTRKKQGNGYVVHNRRYQLTHLLEYGHATVNGKRARAFPHIRPTEEQMIKEFEERIERVIKQ